MLLNTAQARVVVNYTYDRYEDQDTDDTADDEIVSETKSYALNFSGVQINHMAAAKRPLRSLPGEITHQRRAWDHR